MNRLVAVAALLALAGCDPKPVPKTASPASFAAAPVAAVAPASPVDPIAWRYGDVDAAFAEARAANKPVFLYWGAEWCPPCNQMKATLFKTREFIARTEYFVPVYIDGDKPAAQKMATRFGVSGYPTMVLFAPDGTEVTRLPGEADAERYLQVLTLGMNAARPVRTSLATALKDGRGLTVDDWRMLAWYSWDTDDQQLVPTARVAATLKTLADRCPADFADARTRLYLKTLAAAGVKDRPPTIAIDRKDGLARVSTVLASPDAARAHYDLLANGMPEIVRATTAAGSPERAALLADADRALSKLAADTGLSNTDRVGATIARVQIATLDRPGGSAIPEALTADVQAEVARADRDAKDVLERQTVISSATYLLAIAGMVDRSDAMLKAELTRSHSPYYFMLGLASNARKRGDNTAAIDWYAKAYETSKGPATRLQWGVVYLDALVDLTPDDAPRIERVAAAVLGEVAPSAESFDGRNRTRLSGMSAKLSAWNANGRHAAEAGRIADAARALCARLPEGAPERARCGELLKVSAKTV